jgi:hypothetical protein
VASFGYCRRFMFVACFRYSRRFVFFTFFRYSRRFVFVASFRYFIGVCVHVCTEEPQLFRGKIATVLATV